MADVEMKSTHDKTVEISKKDKKSQPYKAPKKEKKKLSERIRNFFRVYKAELSRITWTPKEQVKKNSIVVLVVVITAAVVLGLVDIVFSKGIIALGSLI